MPRCELVHSGAGESNGPIVMAYVTTVNMCRKVCNEDLLVYNNYDAINLQSEFNFLIMLRKTVLHIKLSFVFLDLTAQILSRMAL